MYVNIGLKAKVNPIGMLIQMDRNANQMESYDLRLDCARSKPIGIIVNTRKSGENLGFQHM